MSKNIKSYILIALSILTIILLILIATTSNQNKKIINQSIDKPKGIMILIEYKDIIGLSNFVGQMKERNIHGLLMVTPEFVQKNCSAIKEIIKNDIEIVASNIGAPLWDIPYEEQKARIIEMKEGIEACTNVPIRIISSTYMASDATTIKVAKELGIPYVTARGTTDSKATIYKVEDYPEVKILSVSNIPQVQYKYGSLCDYSYFERNGSPQDMLSELSRSLEPLNTKEKIRYGNQHKITPVSHTNIGGYLKPWNDMWLEFWDSNKDNIEWVDLDEFMKEPDWTLPLWQIPLNKNNPYTPDRIRPVVSYDEIEKVHNPCRVEGLEDLLLEQTNAKNIGEKIMMFHNNQGEMCLQAKTFLKTVNYPIEEHLTTEEDFNVKLDNIKKEFDSSEGIHPLFGYYPIIFIKDRVFSGFNESIQNEILKEINEK